MNNPQHRFSSPENYFSGLLNDEQLAAVASVQKGVRKMAEFAQRINTMIVENKLAIKPLPTVQYEAGRVLHEIDEVLFDNDSAMNQLRRAAGAERLAA